MTGQKSTLTLFKHISAGLQHHRFQNHVSNPYYNLTVPISFGCIVRMILIFTLFITTNTRAQSDYSSSNSGGAITYYGANMEDGEFRIATHPVVTENNIPKGKYYSLVPTSFEMPQTNLEYYPGAEKIAISFKFDTSFVKVSDMRYSLVTADSSVLVNWSRLPKGRWVPQGGSRTILFLEDMACKNQVVFIKLYHINNPESVITQIVNTQKLQQPQLWGAAVSERSKNSLPRKYPIGNRNLLRQFQAFSLDGLSIDMDEKLNGLGISIHTDVPYFFRAYIIRQVKNKTDTVDLPSNWIKFVKGGYLDQIALTSSDIDWNKLPTPLYSINIPGSVVKDEGSYQVFVANVDYREGWRASGKALPLVVSNMLSFKVKQSRFFSSSDVLVITGLIVLLGSAYFLYLKQRQRLRLQKEQQTTKEARLSMQAVQSQLNPHFIFNALSGIQNLMNKQENEKANAYLTTFSKLTRMVLNDAHKDLIPLKDETELLNYYLQMEQLRFGFGYRIYVAQEIDSQNTEIPPMLLQPFIENAVKHGIASLKEAGAIQINIRREKNDIIVEITDNGKGFNPSVSYSGKGLELSKSRLSLLSTIYGPIFDLDIRSRVSETQIILTIKNWLT